MSKLEKTNVPGLFVMKDFITREEEQWLVDQIHQDPWKRNRSGTRDVQAYGVSHTPDTFKIVRGAPVIPLPEYTKMLIPKIREIVDECFPTHKYMTKLGDSSLNELFVNKYSPDDELRFHRDHTTTYEDIIVGISLLVDCTFRFQPYHDRRSRNIPIYLPARSIYFMTGDSRRNYKHGINKGDCQGDRISLTFRIVNERNIVSLT